MHFKEDGGFIPALRSLQATGIAPTALFCAHDGLALTAVSELLARGYKIPEDMSVVGFGDFSAATQISPQLTIIKVQGLEMGVAAFAGAHRDPRRNSACQTHSDCIHICRTSITRASAEAGEES